MFKEAQQIIPLENNENKNKTTPPTKKEIPTTKEKKESKTKENSKSLDKCPKMVSKTTKSSDMTTKIPVKNWIFHSLRPAKYYYNNFKKE